MSLKANQMVQKKRSVNLKAEQQTTKRNTLRKQIYTNKFDTLDEMGKFLEKHKLPKPVQENRKSKQP